MALIDTLTQRTEKQGGLFAIETAGIIYNIFTTILIACLYNQMDHPGEMLLGRIGIVVMTGLFFALYQWHPCRLTTFVRVTGQLALLAYWYPDTYEFNCLFTNLDHLFANWEQALFSCQPAIVFSQLCCNKFWSEAFNMGYFAYYPMIFIVVLFYFFARYKKYMEAAFIVLCSFFIYYLIYIFLPVTGPQYYFHAIGMDQVMAGNFSEVGDYFKYHSELLPAPNEIDGFFFRMVEQSQATGERPTAAFPSSHVGISTILMILAWKGKRLLFVMLLPFYILLCGATVYIQAHYLIDAIAGFVSAFLIYACSKSIYSRTREYRFTQQ